MSLRAKLVAALGLLLTAGLVAFGVVTYNRYSAAEYSRLDNQLGDLARSVERDLNVKAGLDAGPERGPGDPGQGVSFGSYAELRDGSDSVVASIGGAGPDLPAHIERSDQPFTIESSNWRVLTSVDLRYKDHTVIVAVPLGDVAESIRSLLLIESIAGASLLAVLLIGAWLILRRGLRPLEHMADAAGTIHAGDMSVRVTPADGRGEIGQLGLALNSMLDDLQQSFAAQKASEAKLRQFLADASHELRTPLTSIQGFAELYRLGVDNEHVDQQVAMRRIEEESKRMRTLVDDLLLLARLDEHRAIEPTRVDLAVLAADACSDAVASDPDRTVTLDAPAAVVVEGVQDHLRQAVANLVSNALGHTPAGTPIELSAHTDAGRARLTVRDHGPGLDDDALRHAFDRFWRADPSRVGPKAGLGLSIVAAIAESHGGIATATNHRDGGAEFTLELPLAAAAPSARGLPANS